ncbi:DUF4920 domain-containing protein [Polaribacter sp.]|nr:DUF4920 domain-containing protein [Polaribacter sp.]
MKKIVFILVAFISLYSCKESKKEIDSSQKEIATVYTSIGKEISEENTIAENEMLAKFSKLTVGDTIDVKFSSIIKDLCSKKGCWMKLPLADDTETMVRFKDYGFFMPLDAKGKEVIVNGKAFVQETSVEELQHYAADAGKTETEIALITEPKTEYTFIADGVLLKADLDNDAK